MGYGSISYIFNHEFYTLIFFVFERLVTDLLFTDKYGGESLNSVAFFCFHKNTNNQVYLNLISWIGDLVMLFKFIS